MTDELIEQVARALCLRSLGNISDENRAQLLVNRGWQNWELAAQTALAAINLPARDRASYTQGWNEAIEAAAEAFEAEAETWLQLPARGSCSRLGAQAIRALTKENSDASSD